MHAKTMRGRRGGQTFVVDRVHVRMMIKGGGTKGKGEEGEDKSLWLKEACEKDEGRGKREDRGQICKVGRVHVRRMRGVRRGG